MNQRWCVIANARSGSTWLEEIILKFLETKGAVHRLGEFMNPGLSKVLKQDWILDGNQNLVKKVNNRSFINNQNFFNNRSKLLLNNNLDQSWTMRLFCQPYMFPWFDYMNFIRGLLDKNINFVCLKRSLLDRSISWYFMNSTGVVHKHHDKKSSVFYSKTNGDLVNVEKLKLTPVKINLTDWEKVVRDCIEEDSYLNKIIHNFNFPVVNYETMLADCEVNNIPINHGEQTILKLYEDSYQNSILNYSELICRYHEILEDRNINVKEK